MSYQVSIFLENKLGHLERVTAVLSAAQINIRSIHINHTANGWGILNLVVSDPERAQKLLDAAGQMVDRPGGLDELLKDVVRAGVNFANAYGRTASDGNSAFFVIDIQDIPGARQKLADVGLQILADEAVYSG